MFSDRQIATIVGILFIAGTAAGIASVVTTQAIFDDTDYLNVVAGDEGRLILGALFVLIMGFALALVPIVFYPVARRYNPVLAIGYVVFRGAIETVVYIVLAASWLALIPLSQAYGHTETGDAATLQTLGDLSLAIHDSYGQMLIIAFSLGAILLYCLLYQSKLIPRWLSVWGLIAILMHFATAFMLMFGVLDDWSTVSLLLNFPIFLQEMVMAVWLIVKGFNPAALAIVPEVDAT